MSLENQEKDSMDSSGFVLWTPEEGRSLEVGPEHQKVPLPAIPLPIHRQDLTEEGPSADAIGNGIYDYLRQFPDCPWNLQYAEVLRDAFPHFIADLGAQIAMLDHKEVDAPYVRRKITGLKILALLDRDNPGLQQALGVAWYDLALMFSELKQARSSLLAAMGHLQRSLRHLPDNPTSLNYLGQIDYFLGDYPAAARRWKGVMEQVAGGPVREAFVEKLRRIESLQVPDHPLVDDLEQVGEAMELCGGGDFATAGLILERLEEEGTLPREFPAPEFHYFLGWCRGKNGDAGGAFASFEKALEIDPDYAPAREGRDMVLDGRRF